MARKTHARKGASAETHTDDHSNARSSGLCSSIYDGCTFWASFSVTCESSRHDSRERRRTNCVQTSKADKMTERDKADHQVGSWVSMMARSAGKSPYVKRPSMALSDWNSILHNRMHAQDKPTVLSP